MSRALAAPPGAAHSLASERRRARGGRARLRQPGPRTDPVLLAVFLPGQRSARQTGLSQRYPHAATHRPRSGARPGILRPGARRTQEDGDARHSPLAAASRRDGPGRWRVKERAMEFITSFIHNGTWGPFKDLIELMSL